MLITLASQVADVSDDIVMQNRLLIEQNERCMKMMMDNINDDPRNSFSVN